MGHTPKNTGTQGADKNTRTPDTHTGNDTHAQKIPIQNTPPIGTQMEWFGEMSNIPENWRYTGEGEHCNSLTIEYTGQDTPPPARDLVADYKDNEQVMTAIADLKKEIAHKTHPRFKTGQTIQFLGGYAGNILFQSEITGFDEDGGIYIVWDCYWFAIKDEVKRQIKIIE